MSKLRLDRILLFSSIILWITIATLHFREIYIHAVDIPASDEWELLNNDENLALKDPKWIVSQHNEHRIIPTKIMNVLFAFTMDWNLRWQVLLNFWIYLGLVFYLALLLAKLTPERPWIPILASIFLLTALPWEDHLWAFQSQFHFLIIASLWSCHQFFYKSINPRRVWCLTLAGMLCITSLSAGIPVALALLGLLGAKLLYDYFKNTHKVKKTHILAYIVLFGCIGMSCWAYFTFDYVKTQSSIANLALPYKWSFWEYLFNLVSLGYGITHVNWQLGFAYFALSYLPLVIFIWQRKDNFQKGDWLLLGIYTAVSVILATITMGRGATFGVNQSKSSRYAEFASLLVPLALIAWYLVLRSYRRLSVVLVGLFFLITMYSLRNSWNFRAVYHEAWTFRNAGRDCVFQYYASEGDGTCSTIYPWGSIKDRLENARTLRVSFYKDWEARAGRTSAE
jgi:hypothetical protein